MESAPSPTPAPSGPLDAGTLRPLTWPVLVSAGANLIAGYAWFFTSCLGFFFTAPLLVLCCFELVYFARAPQMPAAELERRTRVLATFELLLGLLNFGVSIVCGAFVLIQLRKLQPQLRG